MGILILLDVSWFLPDHLLWYVPAAIKDGMQPMARSFLSDALVWGGLVFAGFVVGSLAPQSKIKLACALSVPAGLIFGIGNLMAGFCGYRVDLPGLDGAATLMLITLVIGAVCCSAGGALAWLATRGHHAWRSE
jgi:uncharacterized membrane protein YedE/YeeE